MNIVAASLPSASPRSLATRLILLFALWFVPGLSAAVPWLHVEGNQIKDAGGDPVTLRGVSLLAPEHNNEFTDGGRKPISEMLTWQADAARGWYSRIVRLSVTTAKVRDPERAFAEIIDPYVQLAVAKGLYIIVDLHLVSDFDAGSGSGVKQQLVLDFWNYVAPRYANTPNVLFEVYNEPINPDNWTSWKNYIQPVVNAIRAVAPDNLVLVGNPQWSTRVNAAVTDPILGDNIVYVYHIYPNQGAPTVANLDAKFGSAAASIPIMVTEFGWDQDAAYSDAVTAGSTSAWGSPFRTYLDARPNISWVSYIFDNYWKPEYFDPNWNLLSGENQGAFMQQWFSEKRDSGQPQPTALTAAPVTDGQINLTWPRVAGATGYHVKRSSTSGGSYATIATVSGTTYADTGLAAATTYHYVVSATTAGGEGPDGTEASASTDSPGYFPDVPIGLTVNAGDGQVDLTWKAATGAASYNVKRATTSGGPYITVATGVTANSYTDTAVVNGQPYYYVVSAEGTKESPNSGDGSDLPSSVTTIIDNTDSSAVVVTGAWTASSGSPGYYGSNYLHDGNTGATGGKSVRFTPTLPVNGKYLVAVRWVAASNRATNVPIDVIHTDGTTTFTADQWYRGSEWVPVGIFNFNAGTAGSVLIRNDGANGYVVADAVKFSLTDGSITTPAAPSALTATVVSSGEIALTWTDNASDESGYKLDRATNAAFTQGVVTTTLDADTISRQVSGLTAGVTYYFRVRAFNLAGESANSNSASATTSGLSVPASPSNLTAVATSTTQIALTWTDHAVNESNLELQRAADSAFSTGLVVTTLPTDSSSATVTGLTPGTTYYFRVRATNAAGASDWSNVANATTQPDSPPGAVTTTLTINQQAGGSTWNAVGTFTFAAGTGGSVKIRTDGTSGYVVADAVKFSLSGQSDVILDSENASGITVVGAWTDSTGTPGFWGSGYKHDQNSGKGTKSVTYTPNLPVAGNWTVSLYWTAASNRASNVPVDIVHDEASNLAPDAPTSLACTAATSSSIALTWSDHAVNEDAFELQRATDAAFTANVVSTSLPANATSHDVSGLAAGTTYYFRLRASNSAGVSAWSGSLSVATSATSGVTQKAVNQQSGGGAWYSLGSFPFAAGTGGSVKIRTDGTSGYVVADAVKFTLSGQSDVILDSESASGITVVGAWNDSASSPGYLGTGYKHDQNADKGTKSVTYTPDLPVAGDWTVYMRWTSDPNRASNVPVDIAYAVAPDAPAALSATVDAANNVVLAWTGDASGSAVFELQQASDAAFTSNVSTTTLAATPHSYSAAGLAGGRPYYFRLRATNGGGTSAWSETASAFVKATPALAWTAPASIVYGTALGAAQLNATADVPGTFAYEPAAGTVLDAGPGHALGVVFTPADPDHYLGASTFTTITVAPAVATVTLGDLQSSYDGTPKSAAVVTSPAGLAVQLTYDGDAAAPVYPGSYEVTATLDDPNYTGSATGTLEIGVSALVRHGFAFGGGAAIDGSIQILQPENVTLNHEAWISGDLLLPGTPAIQVNGSARYAGVRDGLGAAVPDTHRLTLNSRSVVRYVVRRVDPIALPEVASPGAPAGTRDVTLNRSNQSPGDFATLRNLALNGDAGSVAVPPGVYGEFIGNGHATFVLGVAGSTAPAVYHFQRFTLNSAARIKIVGPVEITLAGQMSLGSEARVDALPGQLVLRMAGEGLTLNGSSRFCGNVVTPAGQVVINGDSQLHGTVVCDRLVLNHNALLLDPATQTGSVRGCGDPMKLNSPKN